MGKKHKKQMRKLRLAEERRKKAPEPKKNNKIRPKALWKSPPIEFVRGEDYIPVKYSMAESRELKNMNLQVLERPMQILRSSAGTDLPQLSDQPADEEGSFDDSVEPESDESEDQLDFEFDGEIIEDVNGLEDSVMFPTEAEADDEGEMLVLGDRYGQDSHLNPGENTVLRDLQFALHLSRFEHQVQHQPLQVFSDTAALNEGNSATIDSDNWGEDRIDGLDMAAMSDIDTSDVADVNDPDASEVDDNQLSELSRSMSNVELQHSDVDNDDELDEDFLAEAFGDGAGSNGNASYDSSGGSSESESDPSMPADFDFNDMKLSRLMKFGMGIDEEMADAYEEDDDFDLEELAYDLDYDSEADEIISGLIKGDSLEAYSRPQKQKQKKEKRELTRRRRERLEAREAARAINFGKDPPIWQRYPDRMTIDDVLQELQSLVATPNLQEARFPPLDTNANWYVGQLAKLHNLKVKSYHAGKHKCALVLKTSRSCPPDYNKLRKIMGRRQTFFRRDKALPDLDNEGRQKVKSSRPKEGDIVGHNAEEVNDGFGHQLMTRMGWTRGSGLGVDKDGIQVPLAARIKLTKRGL